MTSSNFVGCSTGRSAGLGALEDLVHVGGGPSPVLAKAGPVRHETTGLRVLLRPIDRRQAALGRQLRDP